MLLRIIVWKMMAGRAGRQQHNQARQTDAHGIAEKLRVHEGKLVERGKKNHETDEAAQTGQHAPTAGALDFE
jgi:hypothetical protein